MFYKYFFIIFVLFVYEFMLITTEMHNNSTLDHYQHPHHNNHNSCQHILGQLADVQGTFINCVTHNSVPVEICMKCNIKYVNTTLKYNLLYANCTKIYFDLDRLNLLGTTQNLLNDLWEKSFCDNCYKQNETVDIFHTLKTAFDDCAAKQHNDTTKICSGCLKTYEELNNFYLKWAKDNNDKICFDVQDTMNRTRFLWSNTYQCCKREVKLLYFSLIAGFISILPPLFYISVYILAKKNEREHGVLAEENDTVPVMESVREATTQKTPEKRLTDLFVDDDSE